MKSEHFDLISGATLLLLLIGVGMGLVILSWKTHDRLTNKNRRKKKLPK